MIRKLAALTLLIATSAQAEFVLQLPLGAQEVYSANETNLPARVPVGAATDGVVPQAQAPDTIRRAVWQMGGEQTLQSVARTVLEQLENSGYSIVLNCVSTECGGFDFRFGIDVVPEPDMFVDLRRFRFITARQDAIDDPGYVTLLLSRSPQSVFVQMTEYASSAAEVTQIAVPEISPDPERDAEVSVVLEGLEFETGATEIAADPNDAIASLAERLAADEGLRVLLVGHSDMSGSLDGNIAVSKARAEAVRQRLISDHGISAGRLSAHGVGYLSPRASNQTDAGRQKNRRVEAVFSR